MTLFMLNALLFLGVVDTIGLAVLIAVAICSAIYDFYNEIKNIRRWRR